RDRNVTGVQTCALPISLEDTMTGKVSEHGGRHPLPDMEVFIKEMKQLGISDSSTVIIYDNGDLAMAGRLWWLLRYAGKDKVFLRSEERRVGKEGRCL